MTLTIFCKHGYPEGCPECDASLTSPAPQDEKWPVITGCYDFFPDALEYVARVSYKATAQHHPDAEMHWDRSKSRDHVNSLGRHLIDRGSLDTDGLRHTGKVAWRALAMLQVELEGARNGSDSPNISD